MNEKLRFVLLFAGAVCSLATASAGNPSLGLFGCPIPAVPDCIGKWCADDYCPKNEPCVCVPLRFQCDDYCRKNAPCVCVPLCFGCDDYRKKCLPKVCSAPRCEDLRCGPGCGCDGTDCGGTDCDGMLTSDVQTEQELAVVSPERIAERSDQGGEGLRDKSVPLPAVFVEKLPFAVKR